MHLPNDTTDCVIYIYTHKDFDTYPKNIYHKILAQQKVELSFKDIEIVKTTENEITPKSLAYCEAEGLYALYKSKNINENNEAEKLPKYIGFSHYRRYFKELFVDNITLNFNQLFKDYDVIVVQGVATNKNIIHYKECHNINHLIQLIEIIKDIEPDYYDASIDFLYDNYLYIANMFIMHREHFKELCRFAFNVLFEFDKRNQLNTDADVYEFVNKSFSELNKEFDAKYQSRLNGFLMERLFSIFIYRWFKNQDRIARLDIEFIE